MIEEDTGIVLFPITVPFYTGVPNCYYVNTHDYKWVYLFLIKNQIGFPTDRFLVKGKKLYKEFKFLKERIK